MLINVFIARIIELERTYNYHLWCGCGTLASQTNLVITSLGCGAWIGFFFYSQIYDQFWLKGFMKRIACFRCDRFLDKPSKKKKQRGYHSSTFTLIAKKMVGVPHRTALVAALDLLSQEILLLNSSHSYSILNLYYACSVLKCLLST